MSTIIIRGSTDNIMDDIERAIDDGVNSVKVLTRDQRCLPGAAATEIELAKQLMTFGEQVRLANCILKIFLFSLRFFNYDFDDLERKLSTEIAWSNI